MTKEQTLETLKDLRENCQYWTVNTLDTGGDCKKPGGCSCFLLANETLVAGEMATTDVPTDGDTYDEDTGRYLETLEIAEGLPAQISIFYQGYWYVFKPSSRYKHEQVSLTDAEQVEKQQP